MQTPTQSSFEDTERLARQSVAARQAPTKPNHPGKHVDLSPKINDHRFAVRRFIAAVALGSGNVAASHVVPAIPNIPAIAGRDVLGGIRSAEDFVFGRIERNEHQQYQHQMKQDGVTDRTADYLPDGQVGVSAPTDLAPVSPGTSIVFEPTAPGNGIVTVPAAPEHSK